MGQSVRRTIIGTGPEPPLSFAFWGVRPDVVTDNLARFAADADERIVCHEIGGDYGAWLDGAFATDSAPMVFYAQRAEASAWDARGLLAELDDAGALGPSLKGMDSRLDAGARNAAGRLIGLTYYNGGPFALYRHSDAEGLDNLTSWDAVLDALRRLRRGGMAHPFVPRWHETQTGLIWSLLCHLASEGVLTLDDPAAPKAMTAALGFFQNLCREELVPPASVGDKGDAPALIRWASGRHALTFTMDYLAADAAQRAGRPVSVPLPLPGATGTALMPGHALLCLNARHDPALRPRAEALLAYLGGRASDGSPAVHRRWLSECLFAVPYPELDHDPQVRDSIRRFFPDAQADESIACLVTARAGAQVSPLTHAPWFLGWSAKADALIRSHLLRNDNLDPEAVAERLLHRWATLRASHH